jgi:hypothetical protein
VPGLTLVVPDLYATRQSGASQAQLPRLPALELWLAQAQRSALPDGWRPWLLDALLPACAGGGQASAAEVAAAALPAGQQPAAVQPWLATPVHFVAGLDTIRLHPAGLLRLTGAEQQALAHDFARVFSGSGWSLLAGERRELLLFGPAATQVRVGDPARWLGGDPAEGLPAGNGAAALRRLGAELEMWLHEHVVNRAREARGELPVSALWLWGGRAPPAVARPGGAQPATLQPARATRLHGADLMLDGLAQRLGQPRPGLPAALVQLPAVARLPAAVLPPRVPQTAGTADELVVLAGGAVPDLALLQGLERDWFAPAWQQWRAGRWQSLRLVCGTRAYEVRGARLARLWRSWGTQAPWWQVLLAC